jgi:uncharacterized protein
MQTEPENTPPPPPPVAAVPPYQPPAAPPPPPPAPGLSDDDRNMAMLCHLLGIFTGFLGPLVIWLVKKDHSAFVDHHGRESLNFQLTLLLIMLGLFGLTMVLMFVLIGFLLIPVLAIVPIIALVFEVLAAVAAQRGEWHRYPFNIRLV